MKEKGVAAVVWKDAASPRNYKALYALITWRPLLTTALMVVVLISVTSDL